jgi:hypothetical protein
MLQVNVSNVLAYSVKKAGKSFDVKVSDFSPEVVASIFQTGLGRILNDLVASAKTEAEAVAAVNKKLDAWARGEIRAARESDPVAVEAKRIAIQRIQADDGFRAWVKANANGKPTDAKAAAKLAELLSKVMANPAVQALAKSNVESRQGLEIDIDL